MAKIVDYKIRNLKRSTTVLATSYGHPAQEREHVLLQIIDENGIVGWG
jgi:L-alanine-DL-glutamate epimerase-like enolase superfamily enzyme